MLKQIIVLFLIAASFIAAQTDFTFNGQIRPRAEYIDKNFSSDIDGNSITYLRTRFSVMAQRDRNLTAFVQIQDSRFYGQEGSATTNMRNLDLHQAWFELTNLFELPLHLKMGRMEVAFGNQRLVGTSNFSNIGRSFDGAMVTFQRCDENKIDFFAYRETEVGTTADIGDKFFYGLNFTIGALKDHTIQPYFFVQSQDPANYLSRMTTGLYIAGDKDQFTYNGEFAYQFGTLSGLDIAAMMAAVDAAYTFDSKMAPGLHAGFAYLSGDEDPIDDTYGTFNTLYASNHGKYGYMDYFKNIPNDTFGKGLMDIHLGASFKPVKKLSAKASFHIFSSVQDYTLMSGSDATAFGNEVDLTLKYKYSKDVSFQLGASMYMPGEIFEDLMGEDTSSWAYFMTTVNL